MRLTEECNQKVKEGKSDITLEYAINQWDIDCIADYFFMEYYPDEELDCYYRNSTRLSVLYYNRVRRIRVRENGKTKIRNEQVQYETYVISKFGTDVNDYIDVFKTDDMDVLANVMQLFNEYSSIAWWTYYEGFISSFYDIIAVDETQ